MAEVKFKRKSEEEIQSLPIDDGSIIFNTTNKTILMDNGMERSEYSSHNNSGGGEGGNIQEIPIATQSTIGGIKSAVKYSSSDTTYISADVVVDSLDGKAQARIPYANSRGAGVVNAKNRTIEDVEVAIDSNSGKLYVPTYPAGSEAVAKMYTELNFEEMGFDTSQQGIDKGTGQTVTVPYSITEKIINNTGFIKMIFPGTDYIYLYKTRKQGMGTYWTNMELNYKGELVFYSLNSSSSNNTFDWKRKVINLTK